MIKDQSLESMIKDQVEAEKNLSTLKKALKNIAATNPVILLIDELDRCRPDFAVMMLETIKHVFDVENVQIILITNAEQLKATIKHSYGSETDSHSYLYKFFKYQINLPTTSKGTENQSIENNVTYFRATVQASNVIPQEFKENEFIYEIPTFLNVGTLSLRNIEQIVHCIETLVVFEDKEQSKSPTVEQLLMVFLSFVHMMNKKLFNQISNRGIVSKDFFVFMQCTRLVLPENHLIVEQNYVRSLILVVFNKLNSNSNIYIPIEDHRIGNQGEFILERILNKFNLESEKDRFSSYISEDSYIYDYVDYTINNLSLLNIVK